MRSDEQVGPSVGLLYATNTMGAVGGTVVAGFLLLPMLGLKGTVYVGVAVNLLVFVIAALIARAVAAAPGHAEVMKDPSSDAAGAGAKGLARRHIILPLMLLSGANSFVYEALWTRLLGHIFGGMDVYMTDTDGDGLSDGYEYSYGLNAVVHDSSTDFDGDGLTNLQEFQLGTDPTNTDTDGDGIPDDQDAQPLFNPAVLIPIIDLILSQS